MHLRPCALACPSRIYDSCLCAQAKTSECAVQQAKVKAATEVLDLQRENRQLKRELDSKLNLQSQNQSPRQTPIAVTSPARTLADAGSRASPGSSSRPGEYRSANRERANREENGKASPGSGAQWDDNFFSNIFGSQSGATSSRPDSLDNGESWDDSYFMDLLGNAFWPTCALSPLCAPLSFAPCTTAVTIRPYRACITDSHPWPQVQTCRRNNRRDPAAQRNRRSRPAAQRKAGRALHRVHRVRPFFRARTKFNLRRHWTRSTSQVDAFDAPAGRHVYTLDE